MPAACRAFTRARRRSKYSVLNCLRSNFDPPSVALPGPVRIQGCGATVKSGGDFSVDGRPRNLGSSVYQRSVRLCPCALRKATYASKSNGRTEPSVPQSWRVFQVCDPHRRSGLPLASSKYTGATPVFLMVRSPFGGERRNGHPERLRVLLTPGGPRFFCLPEPHGKSTGRPAHARSALRYGTAGGVGAERRRSPLASATGCAGVRSRLLAGLATGRELGQDASRSCRAGSPA
jgi:hypothetical protein